MWGWVTSDWGNQLRPLSGGEAQRIKLSSELSKRPTGHTIYILDEPTTGLHFEDIRRLLAVLSRLVDQGNTVVVIEHNLDVIKTADWIIDMGPEGGDGGGLVIASGTPENVVKTPESHTGRFLRAASNGLECASRPHSLSCMPLRPEPGSVPDLPGSYQFKDRDGRIIYVGKAKSLRNRLNSYFQDSRNLHPRTVQMIATATSVEWIEVATEVDALMLEYSLIQRHQPRFNIRLRDDKSYPIFGGHSSR